MKRSIYALSVLLAVATHASHAQANVHTGIGEQVFSCQSSPYDICALASKMEAFLNQRLPIKRNELVTIEKAQATRNVVTLVLRLDEANGNEFRDAIRSNPDDGETMKQMVVEQISKESCNDRNIFDFIGKGGVLNYRFLYADDEILSTVSISYCES